jgi:hypothetical protein
MKITITSLCLLFFSANIVAEDIVLQTGDTQNNIIELYTSQGCSSCPPAESLLNSYKQKTSVWRKYIPMAFHVDYWDYLGWKDKFAQPAFGVRQRAYAKLQRRSTVYTPAFFVNGKSWRPGLLSRNIPESTGNKTGKLKLRVNQKVINASFIPHTPVKQPLYLNLALLGMGFTTNIKAGENAGRLSRHEFVVIKYQRYRDENKRWQITWPFTEAASASQYALAAWVSTTDNPTPIQATGSYLPEGFIR